MRVYGRNVVIYITATITGSNGEMIPLVCEICNSFMYITVL